MDLGTFKVGLEPVIFRFDNPVTGEPLDGPEDPVLYLLPPQHENVQAVEKKFAKKLQEAQKKGMELSGLVEAYNTEAIIASIDSWENITFEGEKLVLNPANAKKLFSNTELPWVRSQVVAFINDTRNFMPKA